MTRLALLLFPLTLLGCDFGNPICTAEYVPGLVVEVRDASTGEPAAHGTIGLARDGAFVDTLAAYDERPPEPGALRLVGAWERGGRYDITISRSGYRTWQRSGVRVTEDECHVRTVELEALLEQE